MPQKNLYFKTVFSFLVLSELAIEFANCNPNNWRFLVPSQRPTETLQQCATVWTNRGFRGRKIDFWPGEKQPNLWNRHFPVESAQVRQGCLLTTVDQWGYRQFHKESGNVFNRWGSSQLTAACCQCGRCERILTQRENDQFCARLYEHDDCDECKGFRLTVDDGDEIRNFNVMDNKVSSIIVRPGCELYAFDQPYFQSHRTKFVGYSDELSQAWNNRISSVRCTCKETENDYHPPTTTMQPWRPQPTNPHESEYKPKPPITMPTTRMTTTTMTTTTPSTMKTTTDDNYSQPEESNENPFYGSPENSGDESEETTTTTSTTTTRPTTTTTQASSESKSDEESPWFGPSNEEGSYEVPETSTSPTTTSTTTTTTKKPTTTTTTEAPSGEDEDKEDDTNESDFNW